MVRKYRKTGPLSDCRLIVLVEIVGCNPCTWRRLEVTPELRLDQVHDVLQAAFEWKGSHPHSFEQREKTAVSNTDLKKMPCGGSRSTVKKSSITGDDDWGRLEDSDEPETMITLGELLIEPGDVIFYVYDFGDNWEHVIVLEDSIPVVPNSPLARFVDGMRASPPEDSGGIYGYEWTITTSQNPDDEAYEEAVERMGWLVDAGFVGPEVFDREAVSIAVKTSV